MRENSVYSVLLVLTLAVVLLFGGLLTVSVLATDGEIIGTYSNDNDLPTEIYNLDQLKIEPPNSGTYFFGDDEVTVEFYDDGRLVDWTSTRAVAYVFVKGGRQDAGGGNLYEYDPPAFEDVGLHSPNKPDSDDYYQISHVSFYFADLGELLITKQFVVGDVVGEVFFPGTITVLVTGASYPNGEEFEIFIDSSSGYGDLVIPNLIPGFYEVKELTFDGSEAWESEIIGSPFEVLAGSGGITTLIATPEAVEITNELVPGDLRISKQFDLGDVVGEVDFPGTITVLVTGDSYPLGEIITINIDPDTGYGEELLVNLIPGNYTVTELEIDGIAADLVAEWDAVVTGSPAAVEAGVTGEAAVEVTINNDYLPGDLRITKQFTADVVGNVSFPTKITVLVTGVTEGASYPNGQEFEIFIDSSSGYGDLLIPNLIPGNYTVTELEIDGIAADLVAEWDAVVTGSPAAVEAGVTGEAAVEVNINNDYLPGDLRITKQFDLGNLVGEYDFPESITVLVTGVTEGASYPNGYEVLIPIDTNGFGSVLLKNLIVGEYEVTELEIGGVPVADVDEWDSDFIDPTTVTVEAGMTGTDAVEVTIINTYQLGSLLVTKEFLLPDGSLADPYDLVADYSFEVTVTGTDYFMTKQGEGNETLTFSGLAPGLYTVIETTYGNMWEVEVGEYEVKIIAGAEEPLEVTFTNNLLTETAWAAHDIKLYRYNERGNWATYVDYDLILDDSGFANIYAGQRIYVGEVEFVEDGDKVTIYVQLVDWAFAPGEENLYVQGYVDEPHGNPAPGRFEEKEIMSGDFAEITVDLYNSDGERYNYFGIHLNVYETE